MDPAPQPQASFTFLTSPRGPNSYKTTESCLGPSDQSHLYSLKASSWETENHTLPSWDLSTGDRNQRTRDCGVQLRGQGGSSGEAVSLKVPPDCPIK